MGRAETPGPAPPRLAGDTRAGGGRELTPGGEVYTLDAERVHREPGLSYLDTPTSPQCTRVHTQDTQLDTRLQGGTCTCHTHLTLEWCPPLQSSPQARGALTRAQLTPGTHAAHTRHTQLTLGTQLRPRHTHLTPGTHAAHMRHPAHTWDSRLRPRHTQLTRDTPSSHLRHAQLTLGTCTDDSRDTVHTRDTLSSRLEHTELPPGTRSARTQLLRSQPALGEGLGRRAQVSPSERVRLTGGPRPRRPPPGRSRPHFLHRPQPPLVPMCTPGRSTWPLGGRLLQASWRDLQAPVRTAPEPAPDPLLPWDTGAPRVWAAGRSKARTGAWATGRPGPGSLGEGDRDALVSATFWQILGQRVGTSQANCSSG